jgi:hypothetical protein
MATETPTQQQTASPTSRDEGPAPEPIRPVAGAPVDGSAATFSWTDLPEATTYRLQIGSTPAFEDVICTVDAGRATQLTVFEMLPEDGSMFYWRVRGRGSEGWLPWSEPQPFEAATDEQVEAYAAAQEAPAQPDPTSDEQSLQDETDSLLPPFLSGETPAWRTVLVMSIMVISFAVLLALLADVALDLSTASTDPIATVEGETSSPPAQYELLDAETGTYQIPVEQAIDRLAQQAETTTWQVPE